MHEGEKKLTENYTLIIEYSNNRILEQEPVEPRIDTFLFNQN